MSYLFPLQKIVDVRTNEKNIRQQQLADQHAIYEKEETLLSQLRESATLAEQQLHEKQLTGMNIHDLQRFEAYVTNMRQKVEKQEQALLAAAKAVEYKQTLLQEKVMEEKSLLLLKEKKNEEYLLALKAKEQSAMDEMAATRFRAISDKG
jgi:flagellar protein FliJ